MYASRGKLLSKDIDDDDQVRPAVGGGIAVHGEDGGQDLQEAGGLAARR